MRKKRIRAKATTLNMEKTAKEKGGSSYCHLNALLQEFRGCIKTDKVWQRCEIKKKMKR